MLKKIIRHKKILLLSIAVLLIYLYHEFHPTVIFHTPKESGFLGKVSTLTGSIDKLYIKNHRAKYRLPYKWNWKDGDEIAIFTSNYGDVFEKEDIYFWKLDIFLDADGYYLSHSETEYFWLKFLKLCEAIINKEDKDSIFVLKRGTDSSEIYTLYHQTNDSLQKIHEINTIDGSTMRYNYRYKDDPRVRINVSDYDCISLYNNACGCEQYIFFDRSTKVFYATKNFFEKFHIRKGSVSIENRTLMLYSDESAKSTTNISSLDFIDISTSDGGHVFGAYDLIGKRVFEGIFPIHEGKRGENIFIVQNK